MREKRYELIWNLILITLGIILSIVGYLLFPIVALVLPIGIFSFIYGSFNLYKSVK